MTLEQITIKELLRDPRFKEYFVKPPVLPDHYTPETLPWRLFIRKQGETIWRSKRFGTYRQAFDGFKKMLPVSADAAINCPSLDFLPPIRNVRVRGKTITVRGGHKKPYIRSMVWKPQLDADMENHYWCSYCRRPTIFKYTTMKTRSVHGFVVPSSEPAYRCSICGASDRLVSLRHPEMAQKWDPSRPKLYNLE